MQDQYTNNICVISVADSGGGEAGGWRMEPPTPVKASQIKDGHRVGLEVSQVIAPPPVQISGSATEYGHHIMTTVDPDSFK